MGWLPPARHHRRSLELRNFWVTSAKAFGQTLAEQDAVLYDDIATFSQTQPVRGWAEVT